MAKIILADKGYDSDGFVRYIEQRGSATVIPSRISAKTPRDIDRYIYKERHLAENLFLKLKNNRHFATRYEKKDHFSHAVTFLICSLVWVF